MSTIKLFYEYENPVLREIEKSILSSLDGGQCSISSISAISQFMSELELQYNRLQFYRKEKGYLYLNRFVNELPLISSEKIIPPIAFPCYGEERSSEIVCWFLLDDTTSENLTISEIAPSDSDGIERLSKIFPEKKFF